MRVTELWGVVERAERELARLGSSRSLTRAVEAAMAELKTGEDAESQGEDLGVALAAGLNALTEQFKGQVVAHAEEGVTVSTDVGDLRYDGEEWYFLDRP